MNVEPTRATIARFLVFPVPAAHRIRCVIVGPPLPQVRLALRRHVEFRFIDVTPRPALGGFERCNDRMTGCVEVVRGMLARRTVATANVTAHQAKAEVNPRLAGTQTLFTARRARRNRPKFIRVCALHDEPLFH